MDFYQVSRSDRDGKTVLPSYYASHLAAMEAAIASLSLDAASVLTDGGDGIVMMHREGDFARLLLAADPGCEALVTYCVTTVETESAESEEIVLSMRIPR